MRATTGFWLAPLLLSVPVFSRDTYCYLAQGALLRDGFDPYAVGPVANPNTLLDNVSPIWTITTAPYGPVFILVAKLVTMVVGNHVIVGTMLLRLCMLPGLALLIWAAPRLAHHLGTSGPTAMWICVLFFLRRHWCHEHSAGVGDRAHARNRLAHGDRCAQISCLAANIIGSSYVYYTNNIQ